MEKDIAQDQEEIAVDTQEEDLGLVGAIGREIGRVEDIDLLVEVLEGAQEREEIEKETVTDIGTVRKDVDHLNV